MNVALVQSVIEEMLAEADRLREGRFSGEILENWANALQRALPARAQSECGNARAPAIPDGCELVLVESPYAGDILKNKSYARAALRDCFRRGEYPYASHLLYTQPGVLDDNDAVERNLGIEAGLAWGAYATRTVVYADLGISPGMERGIARARAAGRPVELRHIRGYHAQLAVKP